MLRTRGALTRARGLCSRAGSRFWAPGVSLHSPPPATGSRRCWLLILGRSLLLECGTRPQEQRHRESGWHAAPNLGEHRADELLGQHPASPSPREPHAAQPGARLSAGGLHHSWPAMPWTSGLLGASSGQARSLSRGAVPRKKPALLWPLDAAHADHTTQVSIPAASHIGHFTSLCLSFLICDMG